MLKNNFIVIQLKRLILPFIFCFFTLALVIFSKDNLVAAKEGISLWANSVLPVLLPFFIAAELLGHTAIIPFLGKFLNKFMRPIFNVPGEGAFVLLMGFISGYPVGAKIIANFRETNICTKEEGERLLSFTNNSGPLFIVGTVGIALIGNTIIGVILLITHILASLTVGVVFRFWKRGYTCMNNTLVSSSGSVGSGLSSQKQRANFSNLGEILAGSITRSISTVVMIGGFIMLFSIVISIMGNSQILNLLGLRNITNFAHTSCSNRFYKWYYNWNI